MATFKGGISGAAPLQIQLGTSATVPAVITGFTASGDTTAGTASRPAISRPSTPGAGTGTAVAISPSSAVASSSVITAFSSGPSIAGVTTGGFNLPLRLNWRAAAGAGFVVGISSFALLYAAAGAGHTWTGELRWEEK